MAQILCAAFAVVGALPIVVAVLVKSAFVQTWAAHETARALKHIAGIRAKYDVAVSLWPPSIVVTDLAVPSTGQGAAAVRVRRIVLRPKLLALLAGRLDVGDVTVQEPRIRLGIVDGTIRNLSYRLF